VGFEVDIDQDACVSSGKCVASLGQLFAFDDQELATVRPDGEVPDDATLLRIARQCPSGAILLSDGGVPVEL
jgi:ferredoxin